MSVIFLASGDEFAAQARIFVHFQHINAGVRNAGGEQLIQRLVPARASLMRQSGDQVDIDVRNSGGAEARALRTSARLNDVPVETATTPASPTLFTA